MSLKKFIKGGYARLIYAGGSSVIREISGVSKDGVSRVRIGNEWFRPGQMDVYGRTLKALNDEEEKEHMFFLRQAAALEKLSWQRLPEDMVRYLEWIADLPDAKDQGTFLPLAEVTLSLLTVTDYEALKNAIPKLDDNAAEWWVVDPGSKGVHAALAAPNDPKDKLSCYDLGDEDIAVRPAMHFKLEKGTLCNGDKFRYCGFRWTQLAEGLALCDEVFCAMPYKKDWSDNDDNAYERSDIRKYLDVFTNRHKAFMGIIKEDEKS